MKRTTKRALNRRRVFIKGSLLTAAKPGTYKCVHFDAIFVVFPCLARDKSVVLRYYPDENTWYPATDFLQDSNSYSFYRVRVTHPALKGIFA